MSFKNPSKFKHTVGTIFKKELWYPDLKPNPSTGDFNAVATNGKWIALSWITPGQVAILPVPEVGKRKATDLPIIHAHTNVTDIAFSPFEENTLATSGDDSLIKLWKLPENSGLSTLSGHKKRVECFQFHPSAQNVLASGSADKSVRIWDVEAGKDALVMEVHGDAVTSISWNWNGSLLATASKDKKIRILDVRANQVVQTGEAHQGIKPQRLVWLGEQNKIASTGFSKTRERQFAVWDSNDLSKPLAMTSLDNSTGVFDMFYDNDTGLLYVAGKGDGSIKVYEFDEKTPYYRELTTIQSDISQRSTAWLPKRACDLMGVEIARLLKLSNNAIVPVGFNVPRKTKSEFQEDLFPPTQSTQPALDAKSWFGGDTKPPKMVQLKPEIDKDRYWYLHSGSEQSTSTSSEPAPSTSSTPSSTASTPKSAPATSATPKATPSSSTTSTPATTPARDTRSGSVSKQATPTPSPTVQVVRSSHYRHILTKGTKPDACYSNLKASPSGNNSVIRANPSLFVYPVVGAGGRIGVIPTARTGKQADNLPVIECGSECLDFDLNPFDDFVLSTVTESAVVQVWKIPKEGLKTTIRQPDAALKGHTRRVTSVDWHPNADNILVSASGDFTVRLWDVEKASESLKVEGHTDTVLSISWNYDGSLFASSSKDKEMRIVDPRSNKIAQHVEAHDGVKGFKTAWLGKQNAVVTVGFSKGSQRQIALWDLKNLSTPLAKKEIDAGAGIFTPYFDMDTGVLFLSGKGDGNIKMFEVIDNNVFHLTDFTSAVPTLGLAQLPKWKCNVRDCEIASFYKLTDKDYVEPLHFSVPRTKMQYFQDDLFPDTKVTNEPAISGSAWLKGENKTPKTISLRPSDMELLSEANLEKKDKKYDFASERAKEDNRFTKEKFLSRYYDQMSTVKEDDEQVLKQEAMEGVESSEWDSY